MNSSYIFNVVSATAEHIPYIPDILSAIYDASRVPGNSIVMRDPEYLAQKMREGKAVIALENGNFAGFCYIECWQNQEFIANSGLIVKPEYRGQGLARAIKRTIVEVSRTLFPGSRLFGITKSATVIRINKDLGFSLVDYDQLTTDPLFWNGCKTCPYYPTLLENKGISCLCQGLLLQL